MTEEDKALAQRLRRTYRKEYGILTAYLAATKPKITEQERKEMEEEWWG